MKARRRIHIQLVLVIGFLTALLAGYLQFGLFPGHLKEMAIERLERSSEKKVRFDKALYLPFEGFAFYNLRVYEQTGAPIFAARKFSVDADPIEFFKNKKIVINRVLMDTFRYDLILDQRTAKPAPDPIKTKISGQIEVPVVPTEQKIDQETLEQGPDGFLPENVYLKEVQVANGVVVVRSTPGSDPIEVIRSIDVQVRLHKPPVMEVSGSFRLGQSAYAYLGVQGTLNLENDIYDLKFQAKSDHIPDWLLRYQKNNFLILKQGRFQIDTRVTGDQSASLTFDLKAAMDNAAIDVGQTAYAGKMGLLATGKFDLDERRFTAYRGSLELQDVSIHRLSEKIELLEHLKGNVAFEKDLLDIRSIQGRFKELDFDASGAIRNFKEPYLEGRIHSAADMSRLLALLPSDKRSWLANFLLEGHCDAVTLVSGPLKGASFKLENTLSLGEGLVKNKKNEVLANKVSLDLYDDSNQTRIENGRFESKGIAYRVAAIIPKSKTAPGSISIESKDLKFFTQYLLSGETLNIQNAAAQYRGIAIKPTGKISNFSDPQLEIGGEIEADLARATHFWSPPPPALKDAGLKGRMRGIFTLSGPWKNQPAWNLQVDAASDNAVIKDNFHLGHFEAQIRYKNKILNIPFFRSQTYGGAFGGEMFYDFNRPGTFFSTKIYANNLDLALIGRDLKIKNKDLAGKLTLQAALNGILNDPNTMLGSGAVDIRNGNLWTSDLFKKMGELPFVRVKGLDKVTFTDLSTTFQVHDKKIWSSDIFIKSETVHLNLGGSIDFQQALDLDMNIRFSGEVMQGALATGGLVPFVVQEAEDFISDYRITGTIKEPKIEKQPLPAGRIFGKKISGLLQNLSGR